MPPRARAHRQRRRPHEVVMFGFEDTQILDVTGPLEVFARTARWLRDHAGHAVPAYRVELVAPRAGPVRTSGGLTLIAARSCRQVRRADTLLISGGIGHTGPLRDPSVHAWIRRIARGASRVGSVCTGAMILAATGLLDGRAATTHWAYCRRLARAAPRVRVDADALYVREGKFYSSAGVTAGMDMALGMVEDDWGRAVALAVAQELVMYLKRPGGQSQFSRQLEAQKRGDEFGALELWMLDQLDADLGVARLAERLSMSTRNFARRFAAATGTTPAAFVRGLRVEAARRRIESGALRLKDVARNCGFADEQSMRRAFDAVINVSPADYRTRFAGR